MSTAAIEYLNLKQQRMYAEAGIPPTDIVKDKARIIEEWRLRQRPKSSLEMPLPEPYLEELFTKVTAHQVHTPYEDPISHLWLTSLFLRPQQ